MDNLFPIDFEVYIAGIKMQSISVTITSAFNAIPTCNIAMPPDARLFGIGRQDKVPVQVFMSATLAEHALDPDYLLLFDGFVSGFGYASTSLGREFTVTAEAIPGIFKDVKLQLMQSISEYLRASTPAANVGAASVSGFNEMTFPASLFMYGLVTPQKAKLIRFPSDFLGNVVNFLADGEAYQAVNPVMQFYSDYCSKVNMQNRWTRVPYFDDSSHGTSWNNEETGAIFPLLKGLQQGTLFSLFSKMAQAGPMTESIYNLLDYVVSSLEYEFAVFASPSFIPGDGAGKMVQMCLKPIMYEALPPACNLMFRSHTQDISTQENVSAYPTRVLLQDVHSPTAQFILSENKGEFYNSVLTSHFWPYDATAGEVGIATNRAAATLLTEPEDQSEKHCGPRVFETTSPPWMGFLGGGEVKGAATDPEKEAAKEYNTGIRDVFEMYMKHVYYMKKYENRNMSATLAFNPYVTPGFPGVIFDSTHVDKTSTISEESDYKFMGQVMVVSHTLTKQNASTNVQMGFVRLLDEEAKRPLEATIPAISNEVTHEVAPMTEIYKALLAPDNPALSIEDTKEETGAGIEEAQTNPRKAYQYNRRRLMTKAEYVEFVGAEMNSAGNFEGAAYFMDRHDTSVRAKLSDAAHGITSKSVFPE